MRKKIEYRESDDDGVKERRLWMEISSIRTAAEMKAAIEEVLGLGFDVWRIEDGEISAYKAAKGPLDIVDPIYESYRSVARLCDE